MTKVKAVSVRVMELFTKDGTSLGLFKVESDWQGMWKIVALEVGKHEHPGSLIVDAPNEMQEAMHTVFSSFGEDRLELDVVKASPSLADKLL